MAHVAVAEPCHHHQQRVVVAIHQNAIDVQPVAGCLPLHPERVAGAAEKRRKTALDCAIERFLVHEAHHQHFARIGVLNDRRNQTVQFREIHDSHK